MKSKVLAAAMLVATSFASTSGTHAAVVATSTLDLSDASIIYLSGSGSLSGVGSSVGVLVLNNNTQIGGTGGASSTSYSSRGLSANAYFSTSTISTTATLNYASSPSGSDVLTSYTGAFATLTLNSNSIVDITVPYTLTVSGTAGGDVVGNAYADLRASQGVGASTETGYSVLGYGGTNSSTAGTLELILGNNTLSAETLLLDADSGVALYGNVSPVPLPGALILFGSSLTGLAGLGVARRRKAAT